MNSRWARRDSWLMMCLPLPRAQPGHLLQQLFLSDPVFTLFWFWFSVEGVPHLMTSHSMTVQTYNGTEQVVVTTRVHIYSLCTILQSCDCNLWPSFPASHKQNQWRSRQDTGSHSHMRCSFNNPLSPHLMTALMLPELPSLSSMVMRFFYLQLHCLIMKFLIPISTIQQGFSVQLNPNIKKQPSSKPSFISKRI